MSNANDENTLLKKAVAGDESAVEQLLLLHYDELYRHISPKISRDMKSVISEEDVLQETFIQAFRDIAKFKPRADSSFKGWLKAIAENRLLDAIKGQKRKKRGGDFHRVGAEDAFRSSIAEFIVVLEDEADSPSRVVAKDEAIDAMEVAIRSLPEDQQRAITLRCLEGKSFEEVGELMNKTPAAVRSLVHRAKQSLQQDMVRNSIWLSGR